MSRTLTTTEAAELAGLSPASFRTYMTRLRRRGEDYRTPGPDTRTPLWDADAVSAWGAGRQRRNNRKDQP
jgi:hypothetical protein